MKILEEEKKGTTIGRGDGYRSACGFDHQNLMMMWGTPPSQVVSLDTKMVKNITDTLMNFSRKNLTISFPYAFENLKGSDADFEMVTSNTIQPITLLYQHNIISKRFVTIFVNT